MTDQPQRSADFLVSTALASPEWMQKLKDDPEKTLKSLRTMAITQAPRGLAPATEAANDLLWLIVVGAFAAVMIGSALVLGIGVFSTVADATKQVTRPDTVLTVFTTVVGFLAGLLSPSPMTKKSKPGK